MLGVHVLLVVLFAQVPGEPADPSDLVPRLARHDTPTVRPPPARSRIWEARRCPPCAARNSHDPEIRNRAAGLVQKIEGSLLTQSTRVRLDFERAPLTDVVRSLSQQAGFKIALYPDTLPKWKYARVTLRETEPVPFWKAMDLLCDAAVLQPNAGLHTAAGSREPTFALCDATSRVLTPNYDHGPFRVSLLGVHYQRDLTYAAPPPPEVRGFGQPDRNPRAVREAKPARQPDPARNRLNPVTNEQFTAQLLVAAEPRLCVSQNGALQLIEAVDSRDNSLIAQAGGGPVVNRFAGYFGVMNGSVIQLQAQLHRPEAPGETIKKLRGVIPISVSSAVPIRWSCH